MQQELNDVQFRPPPSDGEIFVGDWVTCGADMATEMKCDENNQWQPVQSKKCVGDKGCQLTQSPRDYTYTTKCSSDVPPIKGFDNPWDWACDPLTEDPNDEE